MKNIVLTSCGIRNTNFINELKINCNNLIILYDGEGIIIH